MNTAATPGVMDADTFASIAHPLVDRLKQFLTELPELPLTCHRAPAEIVARLTQSQVPLRPTSPNEVVREAADLLLNYSLFTGHPRFLGYICPAPDPLGTLADMLATITNVNAASAMMAPIGHVLERTVIRWLAQLLGFPEGCDGILLSGGNQANLVGLQLARDCKAPWPIRDYGFNHPEARPLYVYATTETHFGLHKAMMAMGLGLSSLRLVKTNARGEMDPQDLKARIATDRRDGALPICVVPNVGTVATGVIDPVREILEVARSENLWVHADGSYGAAAALLDEPLAELSALSDVDSISWDPHKWMRVPYEAACVLVRDTQALARTFGFRPSYYNSGDLADTVHHYERGPQNSRQLRALKVWMSIAQHGKEGHAALIQRDIALARQLHRLIESCPVLEAWSCNLSIVVFRYRPSSITAAEAALTAADLNTINQQILDRIQQSGDAYLTNAVVNEAFLLRACFVNHNTREVDLDYLVRLVVDIGAEVIRARSVLRTDKATCVAADVSA